jgi:hypothetical protein
MWLLASNHIFVEHSRSSGSSFGVVRLETSKKKQDQTGSRTKDFYHNCFPTAESWIQGLLPPEEMIVSTTTNNNTFCSDLAWKAIQGLEEQQRKSPIYYNYQYYAQRTTQKFPREN